MLFIRFLISLTLLFNTVCATEKTPPSPLSISEMLIIALENNPSTKQAWWNAQRAAAALGVAKSDDYPTIDLNIQGQHGREFKFINGPTTDFSTLSADLILSFLLYDFGERNAAIESAKYGLIAANWNTDAYLQQVMVKVFENYYSTLHAQEILGAAQVSTQDAEDLLEASKDLNQAGLRSITDVYTAEATLAQMKIEWRQQKSLLKIQKGKLAASAGLSPTKKLKVLPIPLPGSTQKQSTDDLIALAMSQRTDLLAKQAQVAQSIANKQKIKASYMPKLTCFARGGGENGFHPKAKGFHYDTSLNLTTPLFNGFETTYQNRMAYTETRISMEALAEMQLSISLEVLTHAESLKAAQKMLPEAEKSLQFSTKAYEGVLEKYQAGTEDIATVSNALRQLSTARVKLSDVKTRWLVSLANLAYAVGTLSPYTQEFVCVK